MRTGRNNPIKNEGPKVISFSLFRIKAKRPSETSAESQIRIEYPSTIKKALPAIEKSGPPARNLNQQLRNLRPRRESPASREKSRPAETKLGQQLRNLGHSRGISDSN
jgi:hypothetical protein